MKLDDLQVVIINNLKEHWEDRDVRELYSDLLNIKFKGFLML